MSPFFYRLNKWINFQKSNDSLDDDFRLGYVAFSRARDMLCIACLEGITSQTKNKLESLNLVFYPNEYAGTGQKRLFPGSLFNHSRVAIPTCTKNFN